MQFQQAPPQMRSMNRSSPETTMPVNTEPSVKEIPYDYVAKFALQGKRGNRVQDVINISVEGAFVAVAIGYSFIPPPLIALPTTEITTTDPDGVLVTRQQISLSSIIANKLAVELARDNTYSRITIQSLEMGLASVLQPFLDPRLLTQCLVTRLCGIDFKYSIVDSGSGRELQNQPIHNIAGLGESSGDRPFRPFAKPMVFMPRSTIRIEIEELSEGPLYAGSELYIVLHGYKMLGYGMG
jgi:hypothetical protein